MEQHYINLIPTRLRLGTPLMCIDLKYLPGSSWLLVAIRDVLHGSVRRTCYLWSQLIGIHFENMGGDCWFLENVLSLRENVKARWCNASDMSFCLGLVHVFLHSNGQNISGSNWFVGVKIYLWISGYFAICNIVRWTQNLLLFFLKITNVKLEHVTFQLACFLPGIPRQVCSECSTNWMVVHFF